MCTRGVSISSLQLSQNTHTQACHALIATSLEPTLYVYETVQLEIVPQDEDEEYNDGITEEYFIDLFHG